MDPFDTENLIFYLYRERYLNNLLTVSKDALSKHNNEVKFNFHYALALLLNKRYQQSLQEFESLRSEDSLRLSSLIGAYYVNKFSNLSNNEKGGFENELKELKRNANYLDYYYTAFLLLVLGKYEKSLEFIDKSLLKNEAFPRGFALKGWIIINLKQIGKSIDKNPSELFKKTLNDNPRDLDAVFGVTQSLISENNYDDALSFINKSIVRFPSNVLPLIAKMKYLFSIKDFEATLEIINRIFDLDLNNLEAVRMNVLIFLCRDSNFDEASIFIKKLINEIENSEAKNPEILLENAKLFSRITKNLVILTETFKMIEKCLSKSPGCNEFLTEMGYQCLLQNNFKEASYYFKSVLKLNDSSIDALIGSSLCELLENVNKKNLNNVNDQIDFLMELQEREIPAVLFYMKAKISEQNETKIKFLKLAKSAHLKKIRFYSFGVDYLKLLNPIFLMDLIQEFLSVISFSCTAQNFKTTKIGDESLKESLEILKLITSSCPGNDQAQHLQAKILYFKGDSAEAMNIIENLIKINKNPSSEIYLLMAQIQLDKNLFDRAEQSLEAGLSYNFKVRENSLFHLISGLIEKHKNNYEEAIKYFTMALNLANLKQKKSFIDEVSLPDKSLIYIELINMHNLLKQIHEASKLLQDAIEEFKDTPEEAKIILLSADEMVKNKEIQTAVDMLNKIKPNDVYYLEAKSKLAQIYLKQRKDKQAYLKCYEELVNKIPDAESYVLLGDAYLNILELENALNSYETALKMNPKDPFLTKKMGEALIITHNYEKAINYYIETIKLTDDSSMKLQLADLYIKLKQYVNAEHFLKNEIDAEKNKGISDQTSLKYLIKLQKLLAKTYEKSNNAETINVLINTSETQSRLNKLYSVQRMTLTDEEMISSLNLYQKLANLSIESRDFDQAIKFYKEALVISPDNCTILGCLAKLYMQMNKMELCQQTCNNLLSIDPENEDGTVLMADVAFRKVDFDMAIYHFTQLLSKQPTNWRALVRFIEIMRRTGNLEDVLKYLENAEKEIFIPTKDPGFCYSLALYQWYSGNLNGALRNFNIARQSSDWNRQAIYNMIEICLNPEDEILGEHFIDIDDIEYKDSRSMALKTADRLLKELKSKIDSTGEDQLKYKLFKNFLLLATKEKPSIEQALEDFISLASQDRYKDNVGPILGIALAHTLLKQSQRAKNQLKRVMKSVWSFEDAEYLERCWLLLADYYMKSSKYDLALELLKKILQHNRACCKALEFYGNISEKEQKYKEAAQMYYSAWKFNGKSNAVIGYRLAHCHLKGKRYADAIDVCQIVLKNNPEYPKIKKDILDKALANLRT
nr:tetratricopeptide repeat protein 21B-like [Onthophagus taurus]XP_022900470.1 tetratricopeptide repeat protein 21B-like [Onthophagus taurus]XP_022900471.1 tetratricopeptide repeat protein 21B-like [Onthophagus taurus]